jgi:hypothetical protein
LGFPRETPPFPVGHFLDTVGQFFFHDYGFCGFYTLIIPYLKRIAGDKGLTFTSVVLELLRQELAVMGYTMGIGRETVENGPEAEIAKKQA